MATTNDARTRAQLKYAKNHLKRVPLDLQLADYEKLKAAADSCGETVNGFIKKAITERIEKI